MRFVLRNTSPSVTPTTLECLSRIDRMPPEKVVAGLPNTPAFVRVTTLTRSTVRLKRAEIPITTLASNGNPASASMRNPVAASLQAKPPPSWRTPSSSNGRSVPPPALKHEAHPARVGCRLRRVGGLLQVSIRTESASALSARFMQTVSSCSSSAPPRADGEHPNADVGPYRVHAAIVGPGWSCRPCRSPRGPGPGPARSP